MEELRLIILQMEVNGYTKATERIGLIDLLFISGLLQTTDGADREGPIDMASINLTYLLPTINFPRLYA